MIRVCDTGTFLLIRCQGGQHFKCISRGIPPLIAPCQAPAYVHAMRKQVSVEYLGAYEHRAETEVRQKTDPCNSHTFIAGASVLCLVSPISQQNRVNLHHA